MITPSGMKSGRVAMAVLMVLLTVSACSGTATNRGTEVEGEDVPIPELTPQEKAELALFREPELSARDKASILSKYGNLDPHHQVPTGLLTKAVLYYDANLSRIPNRDYLSVVDFSKNSRQSRFFIINMQSGAVLDLHVAHGSGSDPDNDGLATKFSNVSGSLQSSLGYYRTAETYYGKHGLSLRLDGLSSTHSNVRSRAIVVHSAAYVHDSDVKQGRSSGCLAVSSAQKDRVVSALKNGSIIYAGLSN
jgi:hypothetical protein